MSEASQGTSSRTYRFLLVAVIAMGVVLILGFVFVFGTIAYRAAHRTGSGSAAPAALTLEGTPRSFSLDGDRLAVLVQTPEGDAIVIYDLKNGRESGRLKFLSRLP